MMTPLSTDNGIPLFPHGSLFIVNALAIASCARYDSVDCLASFVALLVFFFSLEQASLAVSAPEALKIVPLPTLPRLVRPHR